MPSENSSKNVRGEKRKIINNAVKEIGFESEASLAQESQIDQGNLNRILTGAVSLTDQRASQLCWAIFAKNCNQGWTYGDCAVSLAESINYSRKHIAHLENKNHRTEITSDDIFRWFNEYQKERERRQNIENKSLKYNEVDHIQSSEFSEIVNYIKVWRFKYDFDLPNVVEQRFKNNLPIFSNFIYQEIKQKKYEDVKVVFKDIRHISHLCGAKDLVIDVSLWLKKCSEKCGDMSTFLMAESTLAWSYASGKQSQDINRAKKLIEVAWKYLDDLQIFMQLDADVVAILSELKLRIPIRLYLLHNQVISDPSFEQLWYQSNEMVDRLMQDRALEPRLKARFKIPLKYQCGIYYFLKNKYEKAIKEFTDIANQSNSIGWVRVEQGAYSWLATLTEKIGNEVACRAYLEKIDEERANQKRIELRDSTYARLGIN